MKLFNKKVKNNAPFTSFDDSETSVNWIDSGCISNDRAMKVSAVYACVNLIANDLARISYDVIDTNTYEIYQGREQYLLTKCPSAKVTPFAFKQFIALQLLLEGNAYVVIDFNMKMKQVESLRCVETSKVRMVKGLNSGKYYYQINQDGVEKQYTADEIMHFKGISLDGEIGVSVLDYARRSISNGINQDIFSENFYKNGGRPSAVLEVESNLSEKSIEQGDGSKKSLKSVLRDAWQKANSGPQNAGKVAVLDNGVKYKEVNQISPKDMDFIGSKEITSKDICNFFKVPPFMIGIGKESYSSNQQNMIMYVGQTLSSWVTMIEQEITLKLLPTSVIESGVVVKANVKSLLRGDMQQQADFYVKMHNIGAYSVNDIRKCEYLPRVEGGDVHLASLNYVPLEDFKELSKNRNERRK